MKATRIPTIGIEMDGTVASPRNIVSLMNECFGKDLRYEDCRE